MCTHSEHNPAPSTTGTRAHREEVGAHTREAQSSPNTRAHPACHQWHQCPQQLEVTNIEEEGISGR